MIIDEEIIKQIKKNDRKVILSLYKYSFNVLMSSAVRYKNNEEDRMEVVNNAFLKIIQNIDSYNIEKSYLGWIKRIVQNVIIDSYRKDKKYRELFNQEIEATKLKEEVIIESDEAFEPGVLLEVLNKLPPATKLVFNLYAIDGYTAKEVAEELEIGYETVKWHIKEARKKLKELLAIEFSKQKV